MIKFTTSPGVPTHVQLFNNEGDEESRGYWLILVLPTDEAVIYYVYTRPAYRRSGVATAILERLKSMKYRSLSTGYSASTPESRAFFLKNGFEHINDELVWRPREPRAAGERTVCSVDRGD